jgi:hypothetical protein
LDNEERWTIRINLCITVGQTLLESGLLGSACKHNIVNKLRQQTVRIISIIQDLTAVFNQHSNGSIGNLLIVSKEIRTLNFLNLLLET